MRTIRLGVAVWCFAAWVLLAPAGAAGAEQGEGAAVEESRAQAMALHVTAALQALAERRAGEGRPAPELARSLAVKAGLKGAQAEALGRVAARMNARVAPLDERARAIIQAAREKHPGGKLPAGVKPPPPPPELSELQRQRDALVRESVEELKRELGPAAVAKLSGYMSRSMLKAGPGRSIVRTPEEIGGRSAAGQVAAPGKEAEK